LLIGLLFPAQPWTQALIMTGLYALGTGGAFVFAWIFSRLVMKGASSPMILEMPPYKRPALKSILLLVWQRARAFLVRAGTIILGISILIWAASTYPKSDTQDKSAQLASSFAGQAGKLIEPVIAPLGYDWKIGIGLIGSFAAREVFNTTLGVVYAVESEDEENLDPLREKLAAEVRPDGRPRYSPLVCLSLLVFYVFAMQCISTIAIVKRETGSWKWALIQLGYMTGTAYVLSLLIFQIGTALGY